MTRLERTVVLTLMALLLGCSDDGTTTGQTDTSTATVDAKTGSDTQEVASCIGVDSRYRALFAQYDDQCAFLSDCSASGQCYCGAGCEGNKAMCAASICADVDADCSCGEKCATDGSVTLCPNYVCKDLGITGCEKQAGCRYLDQDQADKCQCTQMPDTEPNCYCGTTCSADKPLCAATSGKCAGKNPDKCIIVPGKKWTKPYCARCGLFAGQPRCFFVITPDAGG